MNYFVDHNRQIAIAIGDSTRADIENCLRWWYNILRFEPPPEPFETQREPKNFTIEECHTIVEALELTENLTNLLETSWGYELTLVAVLYFYKQGGEWSDRFDILPQEKVDELGYIILK